MIEERVKTYLIDNKRKIQLYFDIKRVAYRKVSCKQLSNVSFSKC